MRRSNSPVARDLRCPRSERGSVRLHPRRVGDHDQYLANMVVAVNDLSHFAWLIVQESIGPSTVSAPPMINVSRPSNTT